MTPVKQNYVIVATSVLLVGGTEIQCLDLVRAIIAGGNRVIVCCYYEYDDNMVSLFRALDAEVVLLNLTRSRTETGPRQLTTLLFRLLGLFLQKRPDIVHVQYLAPGMIPIIAARLAVIKKVFATVHIAGSAAYGLKAKLMLRFSALFCTCFFCVSRGVEEFWFGSSRVLDPNNIDEKRRHYTIYNALDLEHIAGVAGKADKKTLKDQLGIQHGPVIGMVGRLAEQKGHIFLLQAMPQILSHFPDATLLVIGDGPLKKSLMLTAERLGVAQNVRWLGVLPQQEVFQLYAVMDVLAMPSLYEGFGLAAAEAMAAGVPVVGTKVQGLSEIIADGITGCLVAPGSSEQLAAAIIKIMQAPVSLRQSMTQAGRKRVAELFSREFYETSIQAVYEHHLNKTKRCHSASR